MGVAIYSQLPLTLRVRTVSFPSLLRLRVFIGDTCAEVSSTCYANLCVDGGRDRMEKNSQHE